MYNQLRQSMKQNSDLSFSGILTLEETRLNGPIPNEYLSLMSTHNLFFGPKIRKKQVYPCKVQTPVFLYKSGVQGGILFMDMIS